MPGLGQTGWGAGWVRGLKGAEAVMSPLSRPASAPPCPRKPTGLPAPGRPTHSTQAPYLGKDTKLEQSVGGQPETFPACFGDAAQPGRGGAQSGGKSLLWAGP